MKESDSKSATVELVASVTVPQRFEVSIQFSDPDDPIRTGIRIQVAIHDGRAYIVGHSTAPEFEPLSPSALAKLPWAGLLKRAVVEQAQLSINAEGGSAVLSEDEQSWRFLTEPLGWLKASPVNYELRSEIEDTASHRRRHFTEGMYDEVVRAVEAGGVPAVAVRFNVSMRQASRYVAKAREAGKL